MIRIEARRGIDIPIGYEGENEARQIVFGIGDWIELFGSGTVRLIAKRSRDSVPYPCDVKIEDNLAVWTIKSVDVAHDGLGRCELSYIVNAQIVKSATYRTQVFKSMTEASPEPPDAQTSWFDQIINASKEVNKNTETVVEATADAARYADASATFAQDAEASASRAKENADRAEISVSNSMTAQVYDPQRKSQDIFAYTDDAVESALGYVETELAEVNGGSSEDDGGTEPGGVSYKIGHGLKVLANTLMVNSVSDFDGDNSLPATASLVQSTVGNIEILLATI